MEAIKDQQHFEILYRDPKAEGRRVSDTLFIIYFTAAWCSPCQKLDKELIVAAAKDKGIPIYICDYVTNEYTVGYCMVRGFPTFIAYTLGKEKDRLQSNNTEAVITWIDYVSEK
jgi:thioredoxin-like negative regulator of GroEL